MDNRRFHALIKNYNDLVMSEPRTFRARKKTKGNAISTDWIPESNREIVFYANAITGLRDYLLRQRDAVSLFSYL
jgi:hypothetical protein